jgi:carboxylesterase type B
MGIIIHSVLATLCIFKAFAAPSSHGSSTHNSELIVETSSGSIHGFINHTAPDVRQFLGVPFAEPPVENLRFAKPEKKKPTGLVKALKLPNSCMQQFNPNSSTIYTAYETGFLISGGNSEDCLYLSIWAPRLENTRLQQRPLPVLLYIPGGGFTSGGQASLYKIPDQWVQRTQSHIVVIMK